MAGEKRTAPGGLADRLGFAHAHGAGTTALVAGFALVLGWYASWLAADLGLRLVAFLVVAGLAGYRLYGKRTRADVATTGLYGLAALVALTPVAIEATFLVAASGRVANPWAVVLTTPTLVFLVVFGVLAAIPAGLGYAVRRVAA